MGWQDRRQLIPNGWKVWGEGPQPALVMLVGERPGPTEDQLRRPFVGDSGDELNRCLELAGLSRERMYVTNLVKDFKADEKGGFLPPSAQEIARDQPILAAEISRTNPSYIGAIGAHATHYFLGGDVSMEVVHGVPHRVDASHFGGDGRVVVVPIYHPAAGMRRPELAPLVQDDINSLGLVIRGQLDVPEDNHKDPVYHHMTFGVPVLATDRVAIDTEGSVKYPWCLTYSIRPGKALLLKPGTVPLDSFRQALSAVDCVELHNSLHDLGVLRSMGIELEDGQFTDTMVMAFLLQLEPQGLKALALRHCGMEMSSYEELIHEPSRRKALEYLREIIEIEWPKPEPYVVHEWVKNKKSGEREYTARVYKPQGVNQLVGGILKAVDSGKVNKDGEVTDPRARWEKIDDYIKEPVEELFGEMPEATLDDVPEQEAITYACRDADATLRIAPIMANKIRAMALERVLEIDLNALPMIEHMQSHGLLVHPPHFVVLAGKLEVELEKIRTEIKNKTGAYINPSSTDQCADLLFHQLGLKPFKNTKSGNPSTDDKALNQMILQHPVIKDITDYRELDKVKSFCKVIPRKIDEHNRVHGKFRITRVVSGRVAMGGGLNLLALPTHGNWGPEYLKGFVPPEDCEYGTWDLDQVEMRFTAHESEDKFMCELFNDPNPHPKTGKKRDIHSETAALIFGIDIRDVNKEFHRVPAKRAGFGVIYEITGRGLAITLAQIGAKKADGSLWTEQECDDLIVQWFKVYPGVRSMIQRAHAEARRTGMARDMWGRVRYLPGVYSPKSWVKAEAERQATNFKIQAGAQGAIKIAMAEIWKWDRMMRRDGHHVHTVLQKHDELMKEVPDDPEVKGAVDSYMIGEMNSAVKLRVPVTANGVFGPSWGELEK